MRPVAFLPPLHGMVKECLVTTAPILGLESQLQWYGISPALSGLGGMTEMLPWDNPLPLAIVQVAVMVVVNEW